MKILKTLFQIFLCVLLLTSVGIIAVFHDEIMPIIQGTYDYCQGEYALRQGNYPDAKVLFKQSLKGFPNRSEVYLRLAQAENKLHDEEATLEMYRKALEYNPRQPEALIHLGHHAWQSGHKRVALSLYEDALEAEPDNRSLRGSIGQLILGMAKDSQSPEDFKAASDLLKTYVQRDAADDTSRFFLAESLFAQGDYEEALKQYCHLAQRNPESPETYYSLSLALMKNDAPQDAFIYMSRAAELAEIEHPEWGPRWAAQAMKFKQQVDGYPVKPSKQATDCTQSLRLAEKKAAEDNQN